MKKLFATIIVGLLTYSANAQYENKKEEIVNGNVELSSFASQREQLLNNDWRFRLGKADAKEVTSTDFDDSGWRTLDLPHDFQFETEWTKEGKGSRGFKKMCEGWYRKSFNADLSWKGRQILLDFGGIIYLGDVYLNGQKIASTDYGYVGFEADITKVISYDKPNVIAVWASTGPDKGSRWYTGGGLFRDVYLRIQNPTHIARHGVFVSTPEVSKTNATVQVQVEIDGWKNQDARVYTILYDRDGKVVGKAEAGMPKYNKHSKIEIAFPTLSISNPNLWSPDTPYLYNAEVVLKAGDITVDSLRETFGVRWIEFSPEYGMKLNGEKIWLQGCANHHDLGALGAAAYDDAIERMMITLKGFGFNTIRCSHNPYSKNFTRIADRVGMLVVDELIDKWSDKDYWGGRQAFTNIWHRLIPEWIKRDRNCPSVIMWSLGNELQNNEGWTGFPETNDWGVTSYRIMNTLVKRFDPTRKTTVAMFPARSGAITRKDKEFNDKECLIAPELSKVTEVASLNYQSAVYNDYLKDDPNLIIFQSEAESYELLQPFYNMPQNRTVGLAYWGAVEYWGESTGWPKKGWNFSFFRHTMEPYPQAYLIKSAFVPDEPVVHIGVVDNKDESVNWNDVQVGRMNLNENWNRSVGSKQSVYTFTNAEEVELLYNGKSLGTQKNDKDNQKNRNMILWKDIDYGQGGTLVAVAKNGGKEVARHKIETTGKAVALRIRAEQTYDKNELQYYSVEAVDSKGRVVYNESSEVTIKVDGNSKFFSMDNGDHYTNYLFTPDITTKKLYAGTIQVITRTKKGGKKGRTVITATAPGLKTAQIRVRG